MNNTIKLLLMSIALILSLIGCVGTQNDTSKKTNSKSLKISNSVTKKYTPEKFEENDLAIYDSETNKVIKLFMKKDEIDAIFGTEGEATKNPDMYDYFGLSIYFRDKSSAVFLDLKSNETNRFSTVRSISIGNTKRDIIKAYGDVFPSDRDWGYTDYFIEDRNGLFYYLKYVKSLDKTKQESFDSDKTRIITFYYGEKDQHDKIINRISIYDYNFGLNRN